MRCPTSAVVVCTQTSTVAQRVRGLRLGADDWITKPSHPDEVMARIEAVVRRRRRSQARGDQGPLVAGEIEIRADQFQAFVADQSLELTRREFELVQVLADASGRVIEREDIYQQVWGYAMAHGDRSVDVFVRKLRAKLQKLSPQLGLHPHALRRRVPVRAGAGGPRRAPDGARGGRRARRARAWSARTSPRPASPSSAEPSRLTCASSRVSRRFSHLFHLLGTCSQHALGEATSEKETGSQ